MTSSTASAIRPGLRENRTLSGSPHTPSRFISSNYSSPGSTFRQEEDAIVFDLNPRRLLAGFEGESGPQCRTDFTPHSYRRVGDYRTWLPGHKSKQENPVEWAKGYELWRNDLKDVDLGLLKDKLERAVRDVYYKHLVTDTGTARLILVLPSLVPHPVLSSILDLLFQRWKYPSITLLPAPTMAVLSAGLRSGLVIDIGWEEVVITPVYEYRELPASRSIRGMKHLLLSFAETMNPILDQAAAESGQQFRFDFDTTEDILHRTLICMARTDIDEHRLEERTKTLSVDDTPHANVSSSSDSTIVVDWPTDTSSYNIRIPQSSMSNLVFQAMFTAGLNDRPDDHETPLGLLTYKALLALSPDIRGLCMARMVFIGGVSEFPGLQELVIKDLRSLIGKHGWATVHGNHTKLSRSPLAELAQARSAPMDARHDIIVLPEEDYVEEKLQKQRAKEAQPLFRGKLRIVYSLGSWAGASLSASLKIKGLVEIEREKYLAHGLSGASRDTDISFIPQPLSAHGVGTTKGSDKMGWTLAGWG